jgi:hypothetical protein
VSDFPAIEFDGAYADVPLKMAGVKVGTARVYRDGMMFVNLVEHGHIAEEIFHKAECAMLEGLSIGLIQTPAINEGLLTRLNDQKPVNEFTVFNTHMLPGQVHPFFD